MSWSTVVAARLRGLLGRRRLERELDEEVRFHLEMQADDNVAAGMSPGDARSAALRSFGGQDHMKETYRERRTFALVETTTRDIRYAARTLRKNPGYTLTAVAVLALAIGANAAMVSVLNGVLLRPLPYEAPERLAILWAEDLTRGFREGRSALWDVAQWRGESQRFADLATFDSTGALLTWADGVEQIPGASISSNLLPLLGVRPVFGRNFTSEEADQRQPLVLISHSFWQERFAGSQDALGATLVLDSRPFEIIGILPADFRLPRVNAAVWQAHPARPSERGRAEWFVVGRLQETATFDQAQAEMSAVARRLNEQLPEDERNRDVRIVPLELVVVGPQSRLALWMLGGAVFFVFLIAAANVTSLSLARGVARTREMALRASLGASAGRIVRQLLAEGFLLAGVSGVIGAVLAYGAIGLIRTFGPANLPRLNDISLDSRVLAWTLAISTLAGILVGLAPAFAILRRELRPSGEEGGRSVSGSVAASRIRRALVVTDFALAIVLLVGAGLFLRSWDNVSGIDPGFSPERVLMMELSTPATLQASGAADAMSVSARRIDLYERVLEQVQAIPGVESAGMTGDLFINNNRQQIVTVERDDGTVSERLQFVGGEVSADFFKAMGTPLLLGRTFAEEDGPDAPRVAIINDAMARRCWPEHDPVGKRFKTGPLDSENPWFTVVGVVADMRRQGPEREPFPQMFVSMKQNPPQTADVFVRASTDDPVAMAGALRAAVRRVDRTAPVAGVVPLEQRLGTYVAQRRFQTSLLTGFSLVALLMAAVGIYGLIQYSITTRTQEIGIRVAVGAKAGEIFRMILGEGLRLSVTGLVIGLFGAMWLGRAASSLLYGVTATDPLTFAAVSLLLIAVGVAACCLPARRAMKIEPIVALRQP